MSETLDPKEQVALEQSIIDEGMALREKDPEWQENFLSNFHTKTLPADAEQFLTSRKMAQKIGWWDKKMKDTLSPEEQQNFSQLKMNQTPAEFFETIDRVIAELDSSGELRQLISDFCNPKINTNYETMTRIREQMGVLLIPVFARLVAMGYERYDLTV